MSYFIVRYDDCDKTLAPSRTSYQSLDRAVESVYNMYKAPYTVIRRDGSYSTIKTEPEFELSENRGTVSINVHYTGFNECLFTDKFIIFNGSYGVNE